MKEKEKPAKSDKAKPYIISDVNGRFPTGKTINRPAHVKTESKWIKLVDREVAKTVKELGLLTGEFTVEVEYE